MYLHACTVNSINRGRRKGMKRKIVTVLKLTLLLASMLFSFPLFGFVIKPAKGESGLVGWWKLDEGAGYNLIDSSGNGNTGVTNPPPPNGPAWVTGRYGNALSFDGVNDYVDIDNNYGLDPTAEITVEAWVYLRAYVDNTGQASAIISRTHLNGGHVYMLSIYPNSHKAAFSINPVPGEHPSTADLELNVWTHLAMTYDGSYVRLYINGEFDSSYAQSGPIQTTSNLLTFGCIPCGPYGGPGTYAYLNGMIDEVRIYDRALVSEEILTDMYGGMDVLNIGGTSMPSHADPATAYNTASIPLIMGVYEPLIGFARNESEPDPRKQGLVGDFVPRLAKSMPIKQVVTLDLYNITLVNELNPKGTRWNGTDGIYRINGWRDSNPDDITLGPNDVVYMEKINPINEEWIPCTKFAWQIELKERIGLTIHLRVKRTWYIFELRQGVRIHPWELYNGTLASPANITCQDVEYYFERALVQDMTGWSWLLYKYILDVLHADDQWNITDTYDLADLARLIDCAIQQNGTHIKINVCIDLPEIAWYQILAQPLGSIVPKAFAIDHGCWPGTFFNVTNFPHWIYWRRWPSSWESPLDTPPPAYLPPGVVGIPPFGWVGWNMHAEPAPILRGTGPYKFTKLDTVTQQWRIDKFNGYWRGWAGNHVESVIFKCESDWTNRKTKFLNGEFDTITVPRANIFELLEPNPPYNPLPGIVCYKNLYTLSGDSIHFQFQVNVTSSYMPTIGGSSEPNFFGNVHARKAFAYALDFDALIADAWLGEAEHLATWHIAGLFPDFRDPSIVPYNLDRDMVVYHFKNANFSGGSLWDTGFHTYLLYNTGNPRRRAACEMIESVIEGLNEGREPERLFIIDVIGLDWSVFISEFYARNLPCSQIGWLADFADADNLVRPYMHSLGDFSYNQGYKNVTVDAEIDWAAETDNETLRRELYYDLQQTFINECPSVMTVQPYARFWLRNWVHGWYYNPLDIFNPFGDFYSMWKSPTSTRYDWSMFRHDLRHTGYSESPAPNTNQTIWNYTTGAALSFSSPAVADGKVYVGSNDMKVYCLDALTGAHIWNYTTGGWVMSSPAVADGKVYVGSNDMKVYCLDALTGAHIWNYTTGRSVYSSPAVAYDKVFIRSSNGKVYCLDALTGAHIWNYTTDGSVHSSPAVVDNRVYIGSYDGKVYCLDASTGAHIWNYTTSSCIHSSPAVAYGKVFIGSYDSKVYCLDASTGAHIWNYTTTMGQWVHSSPAVADGKVYIGSLDGKVYCLDVSTGTNIWDYQTGAGVDSSPAVADGVVFVGSNDGKVYAFGNVIRVPEDYPTVGEAINAAPPNATIVIDTGIYREYLVINKTLTIIGRRGSAPTFDGGGTGTAFTLVPSASGTIIAGFIITNYAQGVFIDGASNCKIYDNIMTQNVNSGVAEGNNAANNQIYNNIFQENHGTAISLTQYSTSSTIYNNTIILNTIGINIESGGNTIYWNIFIDNTLQVDVDASVQNNWDNGYPNGGNYWSTHVGVDLNCGPLQNQPGSDGIFDNQHTVAVNNVDKYPLVKPFSPHDIGIVTIIKSKTTIAQGFTFSMEAKIMNYGVHDEAFTVTFYANTAVITTETITLTKRSNTVVTFAWNTTGFAEGNYTISAIADAGPEETNTIDNGLTDGWILVTNVGDLGGGIPPQFFNFDDKVDGKDLSLFLMCFKGTAPPEVMYLADLGSGVPPQFFKCDGKVDGKDLSLFLMCFKGLGP